MREFNTKVFYKFNPKEAESELFESRQQLLPNLGAVNVYAEVRGKYARPANNMVPAQLPYVRSRTSTAAVSSAMTRRSSLSKESVKIEDAEGKNVQELQKMLRQERLVIHNQRRLLAERQLKRQEALKKFDS